MQYQHQDIFSRRFKQYRKILFLQNFILYQIINLYKNENETSVGIYVQNHKIFHDSVQFYLLLYEF